LSLKTAADPKGMDSSTVQGSFMRNVKQETRRDETKR